MSKEEHYERFIKGKTAEEILATGGGAITGPIGDFVRVGAAVRTNQELIDALKKASSESGALLKGSSGSRVRSSPLAFCKR